MAKDTYTPDWVKAFKPVHRRQKVFPHAIREQTAVLAQAPSATTSPPIHAVQDLRGTHTWKSTPLPGGLPSINHGSAPD